MGSRECKQKFFEGEDGRVSPPFLCNTRYVARVSDAVYVAIYVKQVRLRTLASRLTRN